MLALDRSPEYFGIRNILTVSKLEIFKDLKFYTNRTPRAGRFLTQET